MALSKQNYEAVAEIIRRICDNGVEDDNGVDVIDRLFVCLVEYFEEDNPRFDENRFVQAAWGAGVKDMA